MITKSRKSIRLAGYDYAQSRAYFITICTHQRACMFGDIVNGEMKLNKYGQIVQECWNEIPKFFSHVQLDEFVIMPNHLHGAIIMDDINGCVGATQWVAHTRKQCGPVSQSLGAIVGQFKCVVTKRIRAMCQMPARIVWQRNYYEQIIRSGELNKIREYIINNPAQWDYDSKGMGDPMGRPYTKLDRV